MRGSTAKFYLAKQRELYVLSRHVIYPVVFIVVLKFMSNGCARSCFRVRNGQCSGHLRHFGRIRSLTVLQSRIVSVTLLHIANRMKEKYRNLAECPEFRDLLESPPFRFIYNQSNTSLLLHTREWVLIRLNESR